jgi:hypothetical protein
LICYDLLLYARKPGSIDALSRIGLVFRLNRFGRSWRQFSSIHRCSGPGPWRTGRNSCSLSRLPLQAEMPTRGEDLIPMQPRIISMRFAMAADWGKYDIERLAFVRVEARLFYKFCNRGLNLIWGRLRCCFASREISVKALSWSCRLRSQVLIAGQTTSPLC